MLQAEPFSKAAVGPTEPGYFYVVPANVNPADQDSWKKSESEVAAGRCLYVNSVSRSPVSLDSKVREGREGRVALVRGCGCSGLWARLFWWEDPSPSRDGIDYEPLLCNLPEEFSAEANADTYINTDLVGKDLTFRNRPMCPPWGLFLALGERRRDMDHPSDYYFPEWGVTSSLIGKHGYVAVRASGDCTGLSNLVNLFNKIPFVNIPLGSGALAACQAHDYCYDLIRSGLHQTVREGDGCDDVLKVLWRSYCGTLGGPWGLRHFARSACKGIADTGSFAVRAATTVPEVGMVVLRNVQTGKCLTIKKAVLNADEPVVQEHCRFDGSHRPNDDKQWFHVLQTMPFRLGRGKVGHFYIMPAAEVAGLDEDENWELKCQKSKEDSAGRNCLSDNDKYEDEKEQCLYVGGVSEGGTSQVLQGSCKVNGVRASSRMFSLYTLRPYGYPDEYRIVPFSGGCWQPVAGANDEASATDGVPIISASRSSDCEDDLQRWRIEPVDPTAVR